MMVVLQVAAEREIGASADVVYRCIADYQTHHARIVPSAISDFHVEAGGVGAGTVVRFKITLAGRTQTVRQAVAEPQPGRVLTETTIDREQVTTFTVTPEGTRSRVCIETVWQPMRGFAGVAERLFAPRLLRKSYVEELGILDRYAQEQTLAAG